MKPEQQRIAIAEACGWAKRLMRQGDAFFDSSMTRIALPGYLNSLDAMHEAEKALTDEQWGDYRSVLEFVLDIDRKSPRYQNIKVLHATAAQRAEAFLRTLNLWVED